jgi:alpha-beta hydrolase superfamily lysophospholipase
MIIKGHGKSVDTLTQWGYFDKRRPAESVLNDIVTLQMQTKKQFPEVPYLILGHSMGSFFIRRFACLYGDQGGWCELSRELAIKNQPF